MQQLLLALAPPPPPTLDNFSPGKNGAALKALREALEGGERFVFLWGPSGSGKTHLLRAFAGAAAAKGRAAYVQAANADWARTGDLAALAVDDALDRYSLQQKRPITLPLLREALRSLGEREASS